MAIRTEFPRAIRTVENLWIGLPDGCRLAARAWLPQDAEDAPVPAVLDAVPYRKGDGTEARDATRFPYIAGHGYACVRLDLRGSGDSEGLIDDEYTEQEQDDVEAVIAWLAERPWCDGAVGMIGVSWGGFSALQAAARNPPALRGIVAIHSSDDRYADDVHYIGGCVLASDMLHWSACMTAYTAQPPDPALVGEGWRDAWRERLESTEPWVATWLAHQRRDDYWRQGSACEHYPEIACPVFAVGGWVDGYRDSVLRLVESVRGPVRGLIGPWGHTWPERGAPGPAIGFLQEVVRFFDCALKGSRTASSTSRGWSASCRNGSGPSRAVRSGRGAGSPIRPGLPRASRCACWRWAKRRWARRRPRGAVCVGSGSRASTAASGAATAVRPTWPATSARRTARRCAGTRRRWSSVSSCSGHVAAVLELEADRPTALVAARLCDVAPDGSSSLIARGVLNLTHREGHDRVVALVPGEPVTTQSTAYAVPAGHVLRLAVSPTYWPWTWPSPDPVTLTVLSGGESRLELPVRSVSPGDTELRAFGAPEWAPDPPEEILRSGPVGRTVARDFASGAADLTFNWIDSRSLLPASATELSERNVVHFRLIESNPLSAEAACEVSVDLARGDWRTRVEVRSRMTCDRERFLVTTELDA